MLTKQDSKMAQGIAIIGMVMLHLFCRKENLPYSVNIFIGEIPLLYYFGLFGDICVPIYCFTSGYAQGHLIISESQEYRKNSLKRVAKLILHFWLILIIFSVVGLLVGDKNIPGSIETFLGNMFLYRLSYNGAWWFLVTYLLLLVICPLIWKLIENIPSYIILAMSGFIYFVAYIFRFVYLLEMKSETAGWIWNQLILLGTSQLSFVIGMIFYKYHVVDSLREKLEILKLRKWYIGFLPFLMFILHCIEESLIIAPITGIVTITCFHLWKKGTWTTKIFSFLGRHSINIWLIHMFFYNTLFEKFIFKLKYPICVFVGLLIICILISYIINILKSGMKKCADGLCRLYVKY